MNRLLFTYISPLYTENCAPPAAKKTLGPKHFDCSYINDKKNKMNLLKIR